MQRLEFTDSNLSNIKPVDVRKHYKDISSRLCLRVYPSGKKSFFVDISLGLLICCFLDFVYISGGGALCSVDS